MQRPCHLPPAAAVHNNLFTNINTGLGLRTFASGGEKSRGANAAANSTWWAVYPSPTRPVSVPSCDFGPMLTFFGSWLAPSPRRRLQQAEPVNATALLDEATAVKVSAQAVSPWCTQQGWFVEQVDAGKTVYPADLFAAQVAARKEGRMR